MLAKEAPFLNETQGGSANRPTSFTRGKAFFLRARKSERLCRVFLQAQGRVMLGGAGEASLGEGHGQVGKGLHRERRGRMWQA